MMTPETCDADIEAGRYEITMPGPVLIAGDKLVLFAIATGHGVKLLVHPAFGENHLELRIALLALADELRAVAGTDIEVGAVETNGNARARRTPGGAP